MSETTVEPNGDRAGGVAPDWGIHYDIRALWNEIVPGLWVGGTADDDTVDRGREALKKMRHFDITEDAAIGPKDFDAVCTLYAWARPVDWGVVEYRWGFMDGALNGRESDDLNAAVDWVVAQHKRGKKVLVRCQAGLNRSGLVAALAMIRAGLVEDQGEAIRLIRNNRSQQCLFNKHFVRRIVQEPMPDKSTA